MQKRQIIWLLSECFTLLSQAYAESNMGEPWKVSCKHILSAITKELEILNKKG
jgi:hypothetical protein